MSLATLVYPTMAAFVASRSVDGTRVTFRLKPGAAVDAAWLSKRLHARGLQSAEATDPTTVTATFSEHGLALSETPDSILVDMEGDYTAGMFREDELLVLRRRTAGHRFAEIAVRNFPSQAEEWRHFLRDEVDLISNVGAGAQNYLAEDASVKLVPLSRPGTAGLLFRTDSPAVSRVEVRRAISLALRRAAIAAVATGDGSRRVEMPEDVAQAEALLAAAGHGPDAPLTLRVLVAAQASDFQRIGLVIEQELALVHVDVDFIVADMAEIAARLQSGEFDALLHQAAFERRYWHDFVTGNAITKYSNPAFDRAYAELDDAAARAILERDLPATPLYHVPQVVAVNANLCGVQPETLADLSWLAKIRPCGTEADR